MTSRFAVALGKYQALEGPGENLLRADFARGLLSVIFKFLKISPYFAGLRVPVY